MQSLRRPLLSSLRRPLNNLFESTPPSRLIPSSTRFSTSSRYSNMSSFKLKDVSSLSAIKPGQMKEVEVEGIEGAKVLLVNTKGKTSAVGPRCTHYGAPLKNGVLTSEGRVTCPWHGACFNTTTGDVEDAPALDPITVFSVEEKDGSVYVNGSEAEIKAGSKTLDAKCSVSGSEKVVVIGGGSGATHLIETLRKHKFTGSITVVDSDASGLPYDRPKLSKALISDASKIAWRSPDFYKSAGIDIITDSATSVDFPSKTVTLKSGKSLPYTKLVLATGGIPRSLPLSGLKEGELGNVFLLRNISHTTAINAALGEDSPKKVVVIGSSFIGMEVANAVAGKKHDVSVIGMESTPCEAVFGAKVGAIFKGMLEKNGVKFYMSAQVSHATPSSADSSKVGAVHLKDGTELPADLVIEGVGVGPATGFLRDGSPGAPQLQKDGSIAVDKKFAVPGHDGNVFAIGDIATYPYKNAPVRIEHWNVAGNAGRSVAATIAGKPEPKEFTPVFWSALGAQLRYCGNPGASGGYDDVIVVGETDVQKGPKFAAYYTKGEEVVAVATMGKDPIMVHSAELMRQGRMVGKSQVENVLSTSL